MWVLFPAIAGIISGTGIVGYIVFVYTDISAGILTALHILTAVSLIGLSFAYLWKSLGQDVEQAREKWTTIEDKLSESNRQLEERSAVLKEKVGELIELKQRLVNVSDHEKQSLGQELHDSLGQLLTAIGFLSRELEKKLAAVGLPEQQESAKQIREISSQAIQQTRNVAKGLFPAHIETHGLVSAINDMCEHTCRHSQPSKINCRLSQAGELPRLPLDTEIHLYRITQEAITNALRHGKARDILVLLRAGSDYVELVVTNDGDTLEYDDGEKGIGLTIMRSRAHMIGAELIVHVKKSGGCEVRCRLPIPKDDR